MARKKLDLVLIHPGDRVEIYQVLGSSGLSAAEPPIWSGLLASYMLTKGYSVQIIDSHAEMLTPEQVAIRVENLDPTLIAVVAYGHNPSASTQVMPSSSRICRAIKDLTPDQAVLLVGGHVASLPKQTLEEEAVDFVCTGEGPVTLQQLIECLSTSPVDLKKVQGLMFRHDGDIVTNLPAPNVRNLDEEMPGMPWHLLPMELYKAHGWHGLGYPTRKPYASIYTTLGCPYQCEFCCIQEPFREGERFQRGQLLSVRPTFNSYRMWSPELVVQQIVHLVKEYGIKHLKIADEMWDLNLNHCKTIYEGLIREGIGDHINMWGYSRVDTVKDDATVELSLKAGLRWYCLGIESASDRVRRDIGKAEYDMQDIINVVDRLRRIGIFIQANYIVGLPEDDFVTMQQTLDLAIGLNTEWINVYSVMPYPGSKLYTRALVENWPLPKSWIGYSQHSETTLPLPTNYITGGQVLTFRDYFHGKYFSNPSHRSMIESKFGLLGVKHVENMMSKKLVRKHAEPIPGLREEGE